MLLPGTFGNSWSNTTVTLAPGAIVSCAATLVANSAAAAASSSATFCMGALLFEFAMPSDARVHWQKYSKKFGCAAPHGTAGSRAFRGEQSHCIGEGMNDPRRCRQWPPRSTGARHMRTFLAALILASSLSL